MTTDYQTFLANKRRTVPDAGISIYPKCGGVVTAVRGWLAKKVKQ